ncbi:hypothetical protein EJ05DRAFT_514061 [Pseudovirgaria hyperparasitica]|uniref:Uncharacterized protein n=1 Tax=Pseudovirgaria hyperparasitica TaxID=470096 RepID=A0A6A6VXQ7_9PEZI|nr:uncharacterized protein EJ05DRAFT_514061 [Pseudovirgaria hyperparasitica]KAF2754609.1 hypothetical protein EJ05DRAFT_514061 [Pseudovirgaria hyperparasitica]
MSSPSKRMSSTFTVSPITPDSSWPPLNRLPRRPASPDLSQSHSNGFRDSFTLWNRRSRHQNLRDEIPSIPISPKTAYIPYDPPLSQSPPPPSPPLSPPADHLSTYSVSIYSRPCSTRLTALSPPSIPPRSLGRHTYQHIQPPLSLANIDEVRASNTSRLDAPFTPSIPDDVLLRHTGNAPPTYSSHEPRRVPYLTESQRSMADFTCRAHVVHPRKSISALGMTSGILHVFVLFTSSTVVGLLGHSMSMYDERTWPRGTSLVPTIVLLVVALLVLVGSVVLLVHSVWRIRQRKIVLMLGVLGLVCAWTAGIAVFGIMDQDGGGSGSGSGIQALRGVACGIDDRGGMGGDGMFGLVCTEQDVAFWVALVAGIVEVLCLATVVAEYCVESTAGGTKHWRGQRWLSH